MHWKLKFIIWFSQSAISNQLQKIQKYTSMFKNGLEISSGHDEERKGKQYRKINCTSYLLE